MAKEKTDNLFYRYRANTDADADADADAGSGIGAKNELNIFNELEKQEIYCASMHELNDPMEGIINVFWQGDCIIWENLIRNYLISLIHAFGAFIDAGQGTELDNKCIQPLLMPEDLGTGRFREFYADFCKKVFQKEEIQKLPKFLEKAGKVEKHKLIGYLTNVHSFVFSMLTKEAYNRRLCPEIKLNNFQY